MKLPREFYTRRNVLEVARDLLGDVHPITTVMALCPATVTVRRSPPVRPIPAAGTPTAAARASSGATAVSKCASDRCTVALGTSRRMRCESASPDSSGFQYSNRSEKAASQSAAKVVLPVSVSVPRMRKSDMGTSIRANWLSDRVARGRSGVRRGTLLPRPRITRYRPGRPHDRVPQPSVRPAALTLEHAGRRAHRARVVRPGPRGGTAGPGGKRRSGRDA